MKTRLLTDAEFKATIAPPPRDVLATATNVIDIWPYVSAVPQGELFGAQIIEGCVEHVYRMSNNNIDHVLVVTDIENVFLTVVIDLQADKIIGHHLLDLNEKYGLATRH